MNRVWTVKHPRTSISEDPRQPEGARDGSWYLDPEKVVGKGYLMRCFDRLILTESFTRLLSYFLIC
jgi:hypothetical protein